ncbi:TRAP transporter small permease [Salinarimonas soli]|uniref:TRAP transporter small permease protein n=1 Tax=Salinarimonas soli TaxID=1638099 RepID=A0A5B2VAB5_9HYPH|nr:TRAP transporter small permease [Salinarimonas soli]KAA2236463.1 TRAP transporter small permease [Salinarimonas soli]
MNRLIDGLFKLFELFIVACLAIMVAMVFGNAILRKLSDYGLVLFGGGINVSEELSRIMFVWLTFVGAVVVARENAHMGVDTLVARFGDRGRRIAMTLSDALVVLCCAVFFWGTWRQAGLHLTNTAPITGMSMIWVYGVGFIAAIGMGALAVARVVRTLTGRLDQRELDQFAGEFGDDPNSIRAKVE